MNITCSKEILKYNVAQVERITNKNATLPILGSILLTAKNNTLSLRATNLDVGIEINIKAKVIDEGEVVVYGNLFLNILSSLYSDKDITLKDNNSNLEIISGDNKINIKCLETDEFPTLPIIKDYENFLINSNDLRDGILSVAYSASISDIKPELSSVYIYPENNKLVFVSTDLFRLAEKKIIVNKIKDFNGIILPFKNAIELANILNNISTEVDIKFSKNQISLSLDSLYFTSRIIDGVFPDYKQIIPKEHKTEVIVLKQDLINVIKLSNIFSNKFNQINIGIYPNDKKFEIKTNNNDIGKSDIIIDSALSGEDIEININHKYLTDSFQSLHNDSVSILFNGYNKAVIISAIGDISFLYLIMPMNK